MREAVLHHSQGATVVIKAAAVADYRAMDPAATKIKGKQDLTLFLTTNPDILREVAAARPGAFMVGFAAETHDGAAWPNTQVKLESKGIDLLVANDVSQAGIGFDAEDNEVLLLDRWGGRRALPRMPKGEVADAILSARARAARHGADRGRPVSGQGASEMLADALGALGATLRHYRDLGLTELPLVGDVLPGPVEALQAQERNLQGCSRCKLCGGRSRLLWLR